MKINKIHIDGFGKFSQLPIEDFQPGLTIFKGANEAGKSTLLAFIRRMLFGFPGNRTSINKYPPLGGGNHGGKLVFTTDAGERCTIERYAGRQNVANVTLPDGSNGGIDELSDLLGNADKDIFENIYAFGLDELQKFDTLNNESLRDKLYSIGAGLGSVSISDVQKSLDQQQRKMYTKTGKKASINVLFTSIKTLDDTINDLEKDQDEYDLCHIELESKSKSLSELNDEKLKLTRELSSVGNIVSVWDDWRTLQDSQNLIEKLAEIELFPDNGINRLEQIMENVSDSEERYSSLEQELEKNTLKRTNIIIDEELLQQRDTISELGNGIEKYRSERESLPEFKVQLNNEKDDFQELLKELGPQWDEAKLDSFDQSIPARETVIQKRKAIENVDNSIKEIQHHLEQTKHDVGKIKDNIFDIDKKIEHNTDDISAEEVKQGLNAIRILRKKHIELNNKKSDLESTKREEAIFATIKQQPKTIVITPQIPLWPVSIILLTGIIGLAYGYFMNQLLAGIIMLALLIAIALAYFISARKKVSEYDADAHDDSASEMPPQQDQNYSGIIRQRNDDIDLLNNEMLTYAKQCSFDEIPDLDLLDQKYEELRDNSNKMNSLAELNDKREKLSIELNGINQQNADLKNKCDIENKKRTDIFNEWKDWLSVYGLSPDLSPESIIEIFSTIKACYDKQKAILRVDSQIYSINDSIQNYEGKIKSVLEQCGRGHSGTSLDTELDILRTDVNTELEKYTQVKQLEEANDGLLIDIKGAKEKCREHKRKLSDLLSSGSSNNEDDFRKNAQIWNDHVQLSNEIEKAKSQIKRISGDDELYDQFVSTLKRADITELEQKKETLQERLDETDTDISTSTGEKGAIRNQIEQLESRNEGAMRRMEREAIKGDLHNKSRDWAGFALAQEILKMAIEVYERDRQPAVMQEAQAFFSNITNGRYERIYSPLDSSDIFVEDYDGKRKSISELSRGTAEQLYLALRFGFIEEFKKHSESLPIVFDDILVNFDPIRSENTSIAIKNLATKNQIFFFTCHPETVDILKDSVPDAQVIDLDHF